eukprot:483722-Amorphochlora_amoeboformis.AAC.1
MTRVRERRGGQKGCVEPVGSLSRLERGHVCLKNLEEDTMRRHAVYTGGGISIRQGHEEKDEISAPVGKRWDAR